MLYKYSEFCLETASKGGWIHKFIKDQCDYILYYTKEHTPDFSTIKELKDLEHSTYLCYSDGIVYIKNGIKYCDIHTIDSIKDKIDVFIKSYKEGQNSEFYFLKYGDFIYLDNSIEQINHNNPILSAESEEIKITISDKAEEIYPLILKGLKKHNADAEIVFSGKAKGFEETELYKSYNSANKYNLFESSNYGELILFYKNQRPYKLYFTKDPDFKDKLDPELIELIELDRFSMKKHHFNEAILYLNSEDRESTHFSILADSVCDSLEEAVELFIFGFNDEFTQEIHILKDGEFIYLDFSAEELEHNKPISFGINNEITIYDRAEQLYPLMINILKKTKSEARFEFINNAKGFEKTELYKSFNTITKYNLFESLESYEYIVLQSHVETEYDYITFTNSKEPMSSYPDDFICSYLIKLERPIHLHEEIFIHISYIDDTIRFNASFDKKSVTKDFIEQYDTLVENKLLKPDEIFGRVSKIIATKFLTTSDFLKSTNDSIISKLNDGPEMYSFDDDTIYSVIDDKTHIETIKNIIWHDEKFSEKYDILKSAKALKKFNI